MGGGGEAGYSVVGLFGGGITLIKCVVSSCSTRYRGKVGGGCLGIILRICIDL